MSLNSRWAARPRLITAIVAGFGLSLLSCGREVTGPDDGLSFAHGFSFAAEFPPSVREFAEISEGVVDFDRVRVLLTYADGRTALDEIVPFPAGAPSVQPSFRVPLSEDAPASGETLTLTLSYITASGDTIFRAGPQSVVGSSRVDLQACKLEYSIVSPK